MHQNPDKYAGKKFTKIQPLNPINNTLTIPAPIPVPTPAPAPAPAPKLRPAPAPLPIEYITDPDELIQQTEELKPTVFPHFTAPAGVKPKIAGENSKNPGEMFYTWEDTIDGKTVKHFHFVNQELDQQYKNNYKSNAYGLGQGQPGVANLRASFQKASTLVDATSTDKIKDLEMRLMGQGRTIMQLTECVRLLESKVDELLTYSATHNKRALQVSQQLDSISDCLNKLTNLPMDSGAAVTLSNTKKKSANSALSGPAKKKKKLPGDSKESGTEFPTSHQPDV